MCGVGGRFPASRSQRDCFRENRKVASISEKWIRAVRELVRSAILDSMEVWWPRSRAGLLGPPLHTRKRLQHPARAGAPVTTLDLPATCYARYNKCRGSAYVQHRTRWAGGKQWQLHSAIGGHL